MSTTYEEAVASNTRFVITLGTIVGTGIGMLALGVSIVAFGGDRFDAGMSLSEIKSLTETNAKQISHMRTRSLIINDKINEVLRERKLGGEMNEQEDLYFSPPPHAGGPMFNKPEK